MEDEDDRTEKFAHVVERFLLLYSILRRADKTYISCLQFYNRHSCSTVQSEKVKNTYIYIWRQKTLALRNNLQCCSGVLYIQGEALNRGLKRFFSIYRPSCLIKAYIRPEKYCFVWAGPLANHSILTSFF
jgi:hypothetical protein